MGTPHSGRAARTDIRFDYVDQLPNDVPPIEQQPTSLFPFPPPVGPAEATYYFPIPLDKCSPTGVFFPSGYLFPSKIDVIVYFHGHKLGQFNSINQYWNGLNGITLREDINGTGKKVVLIAPTMGEFPGSSLNADMGIFKEPGGCDDFLAEVVKWIGKYVPEYSAKKVLPSIGNIVLAGHSGAGAILSQQAKTMQSNVCEVWGFDSMYGQGSRLVPQPKGKPKSEAIDVVGDWRDTAIAHLTLDLEMLSGIFPVPKLRPKTWFYFYWAGVSPGNNAKLLQEEVDKLGLPNVVVEANAHIGGKYHFETVTANFKKRVAAARCF